MEEDAEDFDLDGFDFDEESFEQQWAYKVTADRSSEFVRKVPHNSPQMEPDLVRFRHGLIGFANLERLFFNSKCLRSCRYREISFC